ncbi:MoxR family ATPase [Streptomyces sp. GESEQ-35]|uniref:AAA family ATPase n=1 Tax=Streptomyces sp. GESEQ-35 TaxID=2812657 RepID=UPI001B331234|nr:MoxR family ATPase [Streptomyces sp. GESEQ-35]
MSELFTDADDVRGHLAEVGHLVDEGLATALFLATVLDRPLLLEGEPGVGKTSAAKALAEALDTSLIRLQCYEGLTAGEALYEWNYQRQLLAVRLTEAHGRELAEPDLFTEEFLLDRPLLRAVRHRGPLPPVLLIDEIDRADDEFEALLFEFLGEWAITIPELGTFAAVRPPVVILTSNRSRELHDALRRRCLYHWIDFPTPERAAEILRRSVPAANEPLIASATEFIGKIRALDLDKAPGMAEAIDWVSALAALRVSRLARRDVVGTLSAIAKSLDDRTAITEALEETGALEELGFSAGSDPSDRSDQAREP